MQKTQNNVGNILDTKQLKTLLHIKGDATLWRYLKEIELYNNYA